jgi:serine/threonine protein kinase
VGGPYTLSRYVLLERLGGGSMGVVYRGRDPELDRPVAIKLFRSREGEGSKADAGTGLLREAQAMARLSHPNVIRVLDVHELGEHHPDVATIHLNQAAVFGKLGRMEDVLASAQRAQDSLQGTVQPVHHLWVKALALEATARSAMGQPEKAIAALEKARTLYDALEGRDPRLVATIDFQLADLLATRDPARARTLAVGARDTYRELGLDALAKATDAWLVAHPP